MRMGSQIASTLLRCNYSKKIRIFMIKKVIGTKTYRTPPDGSAIEESEHEFNAFEKRQLQLIITAFVSPFQFLLKSGGSRFVKLKDLINSIKAVALRFETKGSLVYSEKPSDVDISLMVPLSDSHKATYTALMDFFRLKTGSEPVLIRYNPIGSTGFFISIGTPQKRLDINCVFCYKSEDRFVPNGKNRQWISTSDGLYVSHESLMQIVDPEIPEAALVPLLSSGAHRLKIEAFYGKPIESFIALKNGWMVVPNPFEVSKLLHALTSKTTKKHWHVVTPCTADAAVLQFRTECRSPYDWLKALSALTRQCPLPHYQTSIPEPIWFQENAEAITTKMAFLLTFFDILSSSASSDDEFNQKLFRVLTAAQWDMVTDQIHFHSVDSKSCAAGACHLAQYGAQNCRPNFWRHLAILFLLGKMLEDTSQAYAFINKNLFVSLLNWYYFPIPLITDTCRAVVADYSRRHPDLDTAEFYSKASADMDLALHILIEKNRDLLGLSKVIGSTETTILKMCEAFLISMKAGLTHPTHHLFMTLFRSLSLKSRIDHQSAEHRTLDCVSALSQTLEMIPLSCFSDATAIFQAIISIIRDQYAKTKTGADSPLITQIPNLVMQYQCQLPEESANGLVLSCFDLIQDAASTKKWLQKLHEIPSRWNQKTLKRLFQAISQLVTEGQMIDSEAITVIDTYTKVSNAESPLRESGLLELLALRVITAINQTDTQTASPTMARLWIVSLSRMKHLDRHWEDFQSQIQPPKALTLFRDSEFLKIFIEEIRHAEMPVLILDPVLWLYQETKDEAVINNFFAAVKTAGLRLQLGDSDCMMRAKKIISAIPDPDSQSIVSIQKSWGSVRNAWRHVSDAIQFEGTEAQHAELAEELFQRFTKLGNAILEKTPATALPHTKRTLLKEAAEMVSPPHQMVIDWYGHILLEVLGDHPHDAMTKKNEKTHKALINSYLAAFSRVAHHIDSSLSVALFNSLLQIIKRFTHAIRFPFLRALCTIEFSGDDVLRSNEIFEKLLCEFVPFIENPSLMGMAAPQQKEAEDWLVEASKKSITCFRPQTAIEPLTEVQIIFLSGYGVYLDLFTERDSEFVKTIHTCFMPYLCVALHSKQILNLVELGPQSNERTLALTASLLSDSDHKTAETGRHLLVSLNDYFLRSEPKKTSKTDYAATRLCQSIFNEALATPTLDDDTVDYIANTIVIWMSHCKKTVALSDMLERVYLKMQPQLKGPSAAATRAQVCEWLGPHISGVSAEDAARIWYRFRTADSMVFPDDIPPSVALAVYNSIVQSQTACSTFAAQLSDSDGYRLTLDLYRLLKQIPIKTMSADCLAHIEIAITACEEHGFQNTISEEQLMQLAELFLKQFQYKKNITLIALLMQPEIQDKFLSKLSETDRMLFYLLHAETALKNTRKARLDIEKSVTQMEILLSRTQKDTAISGNPEHRKSYLQVMGKATECIVVISQAALNPSDTFQGYRTKLWPLWQLIPVKVIAASARATVIYSRFSALNYGAFFLDPKAGMIVENLLPPSETISGLNEALITQIMTDIEQTAKLKWEDPKRFDRLCSFVLVMALKGVFKEKAHSIKKDKKICLLISGIIEKGIAHLHETDDETLMPTLCRLFIESSVLPSAIRIAAVSAIPKSVQSDLSEIIKRVEMLGSGVMVADTGLPEMCQKTLNHWAALLKWCDISHQNQIAETLLLQLDSETPEMLQIGLYNALRDKPALSDYLSHISMDYFRAALLQPVTAADSATEINPICRTTLSLKYCFSNVEINRMIIEMTLAVLKQSASDDIMAKNQRRLNQLISSLVIVTPNPGESLQVRVISSIDEAQKEELARVLSALIEYARRILSQPAITERAIEPAFIAAGNAFDIYMYALFQEESLMIQLIQLLTLTCYLRRDYPSPYLEPDSKYEFSKKLDRLQFVYKNGIAPEPKWLQHLIEAALDVYLQQPLMEGALFSYLLHVLNTYLTTHEQTRSNHEFFWRMLNKLLIGFIAQIIDNEKYAVTFYDRGIVIKNIYYIFFRKKCGAAIMTTKGLRLDQLEATDMRYMCDGLIAEALVKFRILDFVSVENLRHLNELIQIMQRNHLYKESRGTGRSMNLFIVANHLIRQMEEHYQAHVKKTISGAASLAAEAKKLKACFEWLHKEFIVTVENNQCVVSLIERHQSEYTQEIAPLLAKTAAS